MLAKKALLFRNSSAVRKGPGLLREAEKFPKPYYMRYNSIFIKPVPSQPTRIYIGALEHTLFFVLTI